MMGGPCTDSSQTSPGWAPSGDQSDAWTYQGQITMPGLCNGGNMQVGNQAGPFTADLESTDTADSMSVRWHYGTSHGTSWSPPGASCRTRFPPPGCRSRPWLADSGSPPQRVSPSCWPSGAGAAPPLWSPDSRAATGSMSQHWQIQIEARASAAATLALAPLAVALALATLTGPAGAHTGGLVPGAHAAATNAVQAEASWIRDAQLPDGAIELAPGANQISPYTANYAALGLARAASELHEQADAAAAWRWLAWYQAHQDTAGFVTDYDVIGGTETSTGTYDSTDAYAGTFLAAAAATWQADPDQARLRSLAPGISRAVAAIEATQTADGLTWAKPSYQVRLLMDNAEVYGGLRSAATLASALDDPSFAVRATTDARRVDVGVASLWNRSAGGFDWALGNNGAKAAPSWAVLYPDVMENVWAVAYGLASPAQAVSILSHLDRQQPQWAEPDQAAMSAAGDGFSRQPVGYWPVGGWALILAGQKGAALDAAATISMGTAAEQRTWPFVAGDAGELIALQSGWPVTAPWATPLPAAGRFPSLRTIAVGGAAAALAAGAVLIRRRRGQGQPRPPGPAASRGSRS